MSSYTAVASPASRAFANSQWVACCCTTVTSATHSSSGLRYSLLRRESSLMDEKEAKVLDDVIVAINRPSKGSQIEPKH